ncbi:hypothetical protein A9K55_005378 [Cordyceps militaris]|uniref:F-box domain-containing protein n=1 Tax=Cordyceps militaris TaxID=73501 RepID=A0A2H4SNW6_CORMI|nr:hypothetical protein A9K55_005378 [Cordyceps militaris]
MPLLQLPPEILRFIFEQIGSSFFRQDLNRLTICKQWSEFALPECQRRAVLSDESLKRLFDSQVPERLATLRSNCKVLGLYLGGDSSRSLSLPTQTHTRTSSNQDTSEALRDSSQQDTVASSQRLDNYLVQLALLAHKSPMLRSLCIQARGFPPGLHTSQGDYLSLPTMRSLLSVANLSVLLLDLTVNFFDSADYTEASCELCPTIGTLLGRLQVLQVRVRTICPDALKPRSQGYKLRLNKLVVNLSLTTNVAWQTSATHSRRCGSSGGILQLKTDMQEQAESLVPRMTTPEMLRIVTHSLPAIETRALDVLTGKIMILDDDVAWDQDGRSLEEPATPEPELSEDALAAFLNSEEE